MSNASFSLTTKQWLTIVTVMSVAILEILDSTIVNVSLPAMQSSLGAGVDQITWVLTSYIVASAIMMPLTGLLSNRLGEKRLLLTNIMGFMICSILCGMATSLTEIIIFRLLQGMFGAVLIPLSQTYLRQSFRKEDQGKAMAIWGIGLMSAPVLGPTLGGYITETASWRWIFYVNVPICILAFSLGLWSLQKPNQNRPRMPLDFIGLALMIIAIACLQLWLDQGNQKGWLESNEILLLMVVSGIALLAFIFRISHQKNPIINIKVFSDRNFTLSTICLAIFAACVFSVLAIQPMMLESLYGYPALTVGVVMAPRGLASAVAMALSSPLMQRYGAKPLLILGVSLSAASIFATAHFNLQTSKNYFIWTGVIQGISMGLFMVPLSTFSLYTMKPEWYSDAAGLFSYGRMLGTSIGISVVTTILSREEQINWHSMGSRLNAFRQPVQHWLHAQGYSTHSAQGIAQLRNVLGQQSQLAGFLDCYYAIGIAMVILIPLVLLMKSVKMNPDKAPPPGH